MRFILLAAILIQEAFGNPLHFPMVGQLAAQEFDLYWSNVQLLLHMNGTNGSTTFKDEKGKTITVNGTGVQISTAQSKFGGSSSLLSNSGYLSTTCTQAPGTDDFTIEVWVYITSFSTANRILSTSTNIGVSDGFVTAITLTGAVTLYDYTTNSTALTSSSVISLNTWTHVAIVRSSGTLMFFKDGILLTSTNRTSNFTGVKCLIGGRADNLASFNGYMDDFRYTVGFARNTSNFTVPSKQFNNR